MCIRDRGKTVYDFSIYGTGNKQRDEAQIKGISNYLIGTGENNAVLVDDEGNTTSIAKMFNDGVISEEQYKRIAEGKQDISYSSSPDPDFGTYAGEITLNYDNSNWHTRSSKEYTGPKKFRFAVNPEYQQFRLEGKTQYHTMVNHAKFEAELDLNSAINSPNNEVPSKSGLGTYYIGEYNGKKLEGSNYIFVPNAGVKIDTNDDGKEEIADGKTSYSIDKNKAFLTTLMLLNK
jgi:hypothetical protein